MGLFGSQLEVQFFVVEKLRQRELETSGGTACLSGKSNES